MRQVRPFLLLAAVPMFLACDSSLEERAADDYGSYHARLRTCGLLSDGRVPMAWFTFYMSRAEDEEVAAVSCYLKCLASGSCPQLNEVVCGEDDESQLEVACNTRCWPDQTGDWVCGDGEEISAGWVCDGEEDCDDGSDEVGCQPAPTFRCPDGEEIREDYVCDGDRDCWDGSDEANCPEPPAFRCKNGDRLPAWVECDGELDCTDSSDEVGCAMIQCR